MKLFLCSVYDSAVGAYMTPFFVRSRGEAMRSFQDACADEKHNFARHASDYHLYVLGEFDDTSGVVTDIASGSPVCTARDFVVPPANRAESVDRRLPDVPVSGANGSPLASS